MKVLYLVSDTCHTHISICPAALAHHHLYVLLFQTWITQQMYSEYYYVITWWTCVSGLTFPCCSAVISFIFSALFLLQEFTPGETLWGKPSSSVPWACSATWQTQRQWNRLILLIWNRRVRAQTARPFLSRPFKYLYQSCCCQITETIFFPFSKGDDMESLLFHFLDDWLYKFSAEHFFVPRVSQLCSAEYFLHEV